MSVTAGRTVDNSNSAEPVDNRSIEVEEVGERHRVLRMSASGGGSRTTPTYNIPQELQDVLLDFTVQFLIEQPDELVDFALAYFTRQKAKRNAIAAENNNLSDESMLSEDEEFEGPVYNSAAGRRKSVFTESYDPEEDEDDAKPVIHPKSDSQRKSLLEAMKGILLFKMLDQENLNEVVDAMFHREVTEGENIITQGADGDNFYVIESGKYNIFVNGNLVGAYDGHGSFGELALMYNMPRAATIQAVTAGGTLWAMDRSTFRRIVLKSAFQKRKMYEALLEKVPLLHSLSEYERMNLADALVSQSHPVGKVIVRQGDAGDGMYFVEDGEVDVSMVDSSGGVNDEKHLTSLRQGGFFGELALITHKPRAATVKANGPVKVAFLDVHAFERLLGPCMGIMQRNIKDYEEQVVKIFGSKSNIKDTRKDGKNGD